MLVQFTNTTYTQDMPRVLIVEDDPLMREFLVDGITGSECLQVEQAVGSVEEAFACLSTRASSIDVVLTDLGLPDGSGLDVIRRALELNPACLPLVLSMFTDEENVLTSIEAGALGYIHKDANGQDIAETIMQLLAGGSPISPMIARRVLAKYRSTLKTAPIPLIASPDAADTVDAAPLLSNREYDVLTLIARGFSYREIAELNNISVHTVQSHIKNLYFKLAVHSKNEAVFEATRLGLI